MQCPGTGALSQGMREPSKGPQQGNQTDASTGPSWLLQDGLGVGGRLSTEAVAQSHGAAEAQD